jgi:hypothetical protein
MVNRHVLSLSFESLRLRGEAAMKVSSEQLATLHENLLINTKLRQWSDELDECAICASPHSSLAAD